MQNQRKNGVIGYNQQSLEEREREGMKLDGVWICPLNPSTLWDFCQVPLP